MLDTNMVSYIARGRSPAARSRMLSAGVDEVVCISVVTEAELRYGLAKRPEATALRTLMENFLASIRVLDWGRQEAERYGLLRAKLEATGTSIGDMDLMIAAHAVSVQATLVTNDAALAKLPGLHASTNWAMDV